jgi:uncharacterized protein YraI
MKVSIKAVSALVATLATTALTGGLLGVAPAQASGAPDGKVIAKGGLNVRSLPTTDGYTVSLAPYGATTPLECKVHGGTVDGNDLWYMLPGPHDGNGWVSARYVENIGAVPWCGNGHKYVGQTTALVNLRNGPTRAEGLAGAVGRDTRVGLTCKLRGEPVDGNSWWYETRSGHWIAARYVTNVGPSPAFCS